MAAGLLFTQKTISQTRKKGKALPAAIIIIIHFVSERNA